MQDGLGGIAKARQIRHGADGPPGITTSRPEPLAGRASTDHQQVDGVDLRLLYRPSAPRDDDSNIRLRPFDGSTAGPG